MSRQIVHFETPTDDTGQGRASWGSLFGCQFEAFPSHADYSETRIDDQSRRDDHDYGAGQEWRAPTSTSTTTKLAWRGAYARTRRPMRASRCQYPE